MTHETITQYRRAINAAYTAHNDADRHYSAANSAIYDAGHGRLCDETRADITSYIDAMIASVDAFTTAGRLLIATRDAGAPIYRRYTNTSECRAFYLQYTYMMRETAGVIFLYAAHMSDGDQYATYKQYANTVSLPIIQYASLISIYAYAVNVYNSMKGNK